MHEVLVNHFGGLSLPRKHVVRLTDHPNMTLDVNCGRKTTTQHQQQWLEVKVTIEGHEFELLILCPPHRTHVSVMLAQGQGHSLHLGFPLKPGMIFNITGDILTLVRDGWLHHGTHISSPQLKHFYFQCATQFRPFRPLIFTFIFPRK